MIFRLFIRTIIVLSALLGLKAEAATLELLSPGGKIKVAVQTDKEISYSVSFGGKELLRQNNLTLTTNKGTLGRNAKLLSANSSIVNETKEPVVPLKFSRIETKYRKAVLKFKGNFYIEFRVTDHAVAYRFATRLGKMLDVDDESFNLQTIVPMTAHLQPTDKFRTSYETRYVHQQLFAPADGKMATLPALLTGKDDMNVLVSETGVLDYPKMFLKRNGSGGFSATFPKCPLAWAEESDRAMNVTSEESYIARTNGTRAFPWRYMVFGTSKEIAMQTLPVVLSEPCTLQETDWIRPGKVSWEWWCGATPYGKDVNFKAGCNTATYKYFIDFAARFGLEYILLDEGWAKSTRDPFVPNDALDLQEVIRYGKSKGVGVVLWLSWLTVERHFDLFKKYEEWGVAGVKVDFMDHSHQWMVNFYERVAEAAAKHKLMVDFHGAYSPGGLEFKFPNVLSYEGVVGMEMMSRCTPENTVYYPFIRNTAGAMDYTPGAMINMQPEVYRSVRPNSAAIGTRCYNLALYVIFESGVQMLADNPTNYYKNEECTRFIASVPVTWDETRVLEASAGEYFIVARRKGDCWFVGGFCNGKENVRHFRVRLDFLSAGVDYRISAFCDGPNAGYQAMDYRTSEQNVDHGTELTIDMVRNGGWAAVIARR